VYQPYYNNNSTCNGNKFADGTPKVEYGVFFTSPTNGLPSKIPKKKTKSGTPSNHSPNKKKNIINITHNTNTGSQLPDDFAIRKQRVKTELCMHYTQTKTCPFGDCCTYAHGEDELQIKTLADLQRNCLIDDVENYRTKPCFTFVAIGSWYVIIEILLVI
jgi:hypothetical protein